MTRDDEMRAILRRRARWPKAFRVLRAHRRLFLSLLAGLCVGLALPAAQINIVTRALLGWNVTALLYLALSARVAAVSSPGAIRRNAQFQDEGRVAILAIATLVACASLGAIVVELGAVRGAASWDKLTHIALAILTVLDSWLFMHLVFAFHYAHEYYLERRDKAEPAVRGGLIFPGGEEPEYLDFLYFSYVIGVACQTGDVSTASRPMRLVALIQGTLAFFYNATILALGVNIASSLI